MRQCVSNSPAHAPQRSRHSTNSPTCWQAMRPAEERAPAEYQVGGEWKAIVTEAFRPLTTALDELLRHADHVRSAEVIGPKLRGWRNQDVLVEVGVTVDGGVVDFSGHALDFSRSQVADGHVGIDLERGVELQLTFNRATFLFGDAGLTGHTQVGFLSCLCESFAQLVVDHFVLHGIAVALGHDVHRHLAGTEAVGLGGAGQLLEAGIDFVLEDVSCQRQRDAALQLVEGLHGDRHDVISQYV